MADENEKGPVELDNVLDAMGLDDETLSKPLPDDDESLEEEENEEETEFEDEESEDEDEEEEEEEIETEPVAPIPPVTPTPTPQQPAPIVKMPTTVAEIDDTIQSAPELKKSMSELQKVEEQYAKTKEAYDKMYDKLDDDDELTVKQVKAINQARDVLEQAKDTVRQTREQAEHQKRRYAADIEFKDFYQQGQNQARQKYNDFDEVTSHHEKLSQEDYAEIHKVGATTRSSLAMAEKAYSIIKSKLTPQEKVLPAEVHRTIIEQGGEGAKAILEAFAKAGYKVPKGKKTKKKKRVTVSEPEKVLIRPEELNPQDKMANDFSAKLFGD